MMANRAFIMQYSKLSGHIMQALLTSRKFGVKRNSENELNIFQIVPFHVDFYMNAVCQSNQEKEGPSLPSITEGVVPKIAHQCVAKTWKIMHRNRPSFLILPYIAYCRIVTLVRVLWPSNFELLIELLTSKLKQATIFTDNFCPLDCGRKLLEPGLQPC